MVTRILRRTPLRVPLRDAQRGQVFQIRYDLFREFRETLYHDDRLGQLSRRHDQRSSGRYSQKQPARDGCRDARPALVAPLPLKIAVDSGIGSHPLPGVLDRVLPANVAGSPSRILLLAAFLMVGVAALGGLLGLASTFLRSYTAEQLVLNFRTRVFAHLQRMSLQYHDAKGTADSVYRIQNDTLTLQYICLDGLPPFVTSIFTLVAMFYVTFRIDTELALVAMAVAPFLFLLSQRYRPIFRQRSKEVKQIEISAMAVVQEVLSALRVVKAFSREEYEE